MTPSSKQLSFPARPNISRGYAVILQSSFSIIISSS